MVISKNTKRVVVCGNEEDNNENDCFSPVVDYTIFSLTSFEDMSCVNSLV